MRVGEVVRYMGDYYCDWNEESGNELMGILEVV